MLKKSSKLVNFCVLILILKIEEKTAFSAYYGYYFSNGKNTTEAHTHTHTHTHKTCVMYGKAAMTYGTICVPWFVKFCAEISHGTMLSSPVDRLKLITIKSRH